MYLGVPLEPLAGAHGAPEDDGDGGMLTVEKRQVSFARSRTVVLMLRTIQNTITHD